jgi:hypothetical protein
MATWRKNAEELTTIIDFSVSNRQDRGMPNCEIIAQNGYESLPIGARQRLGGCLGALPEADSMGSFLSEAKDVWCGGWNYSPRRYPHLLLRLYHCVAFLKYEGNRFWDAFASVLGEQSIPANRQTEINASFAHIAEHLGLQVLEHQYVQSAVRHVGIPVRVWRGFIQVCEKLLAAGDGWQRWSVESWQNHLTMWLGARKNLIDFFVKNRDTASEWVAEIHAARSMLFENPNYTLDDIKEVVVLRPEYFEAVPETALFLRPSDPESLFWDRPRLRYQNDNGVVSITLEAPRITDESLLPGTWRFGEIERAASTNPVSLKLNSAAFNEALTLKLWRRDGETKPFNLQGIAPWALWSESLKAFVASAARELPVNAYTLISKRQLDFTERKGWLEDDDDETRWNVEHVMGDDTPCFVTQLQPGEKRASLTIAGSHRIDFAPRERLELRVFPSRSERFQLKIDKEGVLHLSKWPNFIVKLPHGMLGATKEDTLAILNNEFRLFCDGERISGEWHESACREEDEFYHFVVREGIDFPPAMRGDAWRPTQTLNGFANLAIEQRQRAAEPVQPFAVQLQSSRHGIIPFGDSASVHLAVAKCPSKDHLQKLWVKYEDYMPWFLLSVTQDCATWEKIVIAHEMMDGGRVLCRLNRWAFVKIERLGMMTQRGQRWTDFQSRIHFGRHEQGCFMIRCAGLTTSLYAMLSEVEPIERIKAVWERGCPPHLEAKFSLKGNADQRLRRLCQEHQIRIMSESLWTR